VEVLCTLDLEVLTLDSGNGRQPSIGKGQTTHEPMQAIAQMLRMANICLEAELPQFSINPKEVTRYRFSRSNETGAVEAFAHGASDIGNSGACPKARKVVLKGGMTASQLRNLAHAVSNHVTSWYLKEIGDQYKDTENKENDPEKDIHVAEAERRKRTRIRL
jgi:hypothetical protein